MSLDKHKLLVANRGEIAVRISRTAKRLGLPTVAIYTQVDATAPHVLLAGESVLLRPSDEDPASNARGYLDGEEIARICTERDITLLHPGYGFLSENADFAELLASKGVVLLGPSPQVIKDMGLKHRARTLAVEAGVPVVPGSDGLVSELSEAEKIAGKLGYPVMLKATAGGGGMGLIVCRNSGDLKATFSSTQQRAKSLFHNDGMFIEKYFEASRHIEVQIFGNGYGHVIHIGERECSVQRRHQKIIEETPSPYLMRSPALRQVICDAAVRLGKHINYKSAGTVEFLVDDKTGNFYFLEMNTRLQVEHTVTEAVHPALDLVELMIRQGVAEGAAPDSEPVLGLNPDELVQARFENPTPNAHAIEVRVYCENPAADFAPAPGLLQYVEFPEVVADVRVDTWVSTGAVISPFYDPLAAKIIVSGKTRGEAIDRLAALLSQGDEESNGLEGTDATPRAVIHGPPNNIAFLWQVCQELVFRDGNATTQWVDSGGVSYVPSAITITAPGLNTTVQALPARAIGLGIPPSGPMDPVVFQAANAIAGNHLECEGLEVVVPPPTAVGGRGTGALQFGATFHVRAVIAVTGATASVRIGGVDAQMWERVVVPAGAKLEVGGPKVGTEGGGLRAYIAVLGGFPSVPTYLGSKSTSIGVGGYQGRALQAGDVLQIHPSGSSAADNLSRPLPRVLTPVYPSQWTLHALPGPHDDTEFLTHTGIEAFYRRKWKVSSASNRMGIRLEAVIAPTPDQPGDDGSERVLDWARKNGGEGGSHPSNILDNGYAFGSVNLNGDTPVILTKEGPSMGGYLCISTIATGDQWKLGQLRPGDLVQFMRISYSDAINLQERCERWVETVLALSSGFSATPLDLLDVKLTEEPVADPKLHIIPPSGGKLKVIFRQAGDSAILIEYGEMTLSFSVRARIHALETLAKKRGIQGILEFAPCIRSTMCHYDPKQIKQSRLLSFLVEVENSLPTSLEDMAFPGRKLTFPIVLDDKWNRETLQRYMKSSRDKAVYLPSNIEYLAENNGVRGGAAEALRLLVSSPWLVFGVGFYLACPFLVPIDPRCRLVGQKMNPSRTFTPRGAVGIAGLVAAIYPVESPGGYQLYGRTLPGWQTWGKGANFDPDRPWLLEPFDQVVFEPVSEERYIQLEKEFDSGHFEFKIEPVTFSMREYTDFISSIEDEVASFKVRQERSVQEVEAREEVLLKEWQATKEAYGKSREGKQESDVESKSYVTAALSGSVWQIKVKPGDIIKSPEHVVVILEAMKTEINIVAGEGNVGLTVKGFGNGITEGAIVQAGDKLVYFDE